MKRITAPAKQPAATSAETPPTRAWPKARASRPPTLDRHAARPPTKAIAVASPARREELCRIVVERVVVRDRKLDSIAWSPPVRPFFERQRVCPQGDSNP